MRTLLALFRPPQIGLRTRHVVWRNLLVWRSMLVSSVIGHFLDPLLYLLAMGLGLGQFVNQSKFEGFPYLSYMAPGLVVSATMYAATFECTFGSYTRMDSQRTYEGIMVTPLTIDEVVLGDILYGTIKSSLAGAIVLIVTLLFGIVHSPLA